MNSFLERVFFLQMVKHHQAGEMVLFNEATQHMECGNLLVKGMKISQRYQKTACFVVYSDITMVNSKRRVDIIISYPTLVFQVFIEHCSGVVPQTAARIQQKLVNQRFVQTNHVFDFIIDMPSWELALLLMEEILHHPGMYKTL